MPNLALRLALLAALGATASAQQSWSDDFEGYAPDTALEGQGGWAAWNGGTRDASSVVTPSMAHTGGQSVMVKPGADTVREIEGPVAGRWTVTAWHWIPSAAIENGAFVLLNRYNIDGPKRWSGQLKFNMSTETLLCYCGAAQPTWHPLVLDQWVEMRFEVDLDADWVDVYYDGQHLAGYVWSLGIFGHDTDGKRAIAAVDLDLDLAFGGAPIFFDDISVEYRGGGTIGVSYCGPAVANSTGLSGTATAFGSESADWQPLRIWGRHLPPGAPGLLLVSRTQDLVPGAFGGMGTLCLGQPFGRHVPKVTAADGAGVLHVDVNTKKLPFMGGYDVQPGETWNFQIVYRDLVPGATTNLTDAVAVTFL